MYLPAQGSGTIKMFQADVVPTLKSAEKQGRKPVNNVIIINCGKGYEKNAVLK